MQRTLVGLIGSCTLVGALVACGSNGDDSPMDVAAGTGGAAAGNTAPATNSAGSGGSSSASAGTAAPGSGSGGTQAGGSGSSGGAAPALGSGGAAAAVDAGMMAMMPDPNMPYPDPRGGCKINSGFPGDDTCMLPPDPKEGMQIHIGPSDYNDAAQINAYIMHAGEESSECVSFHTPNGEDIYYQTSALSGRAGTHHIINTMYKQQVDDSVGFVACLNEFSTDPEVVIDSLPGASKAYMARPIVAPENMNIGRKIPGKASSQADMHYFNFTESDILREFWMNIYFVPKEQVTTEANQIRGMGGTNWSFSPIQPGTDMVYEYSCPIDKDGRITSLLGHYHAHGKRFTAFLNRAGGTREKVFEMYDYQDPRTFQYDSVTTNPAFSDSAAGAYTGTLMVKAGDTLDWECHIVNDSNVGLTYTNMVKTGEMCNLWGTSIGPKISCNPF
jgi:hypothetical protein